MRKITKVTLLFILTILTESCSGYSPARLFDSLEWEGQWNERESMIFASYPIGSGYTVTYESISNESSENENLVALWENNQRLGILDVQPYVGWGIDGFVTSDSLYLTYFKEGLGAGFTKVNLTTLINDFSLDIVPSGTVSIDLVSFPQGDGVVTVWGTTSEQTWLFIDSSGTLNETKTTSFALSSFESANHSYRTFGKRTLKVGGITYLNFSGNLLSFDGEETSYISSPTVLGFPSISDVLSYYSTNVRGESLREEFILYRTTGSDTETLVNIEEKYLRQTDLGSRYFFQDGRVFVLGTRQIGYAMFPCMLVYDEMSNHSYWSEFHYRDRPIYEPFYLIGNEFYQFSDNFESGPYAYWHSAIPLPNE